MHSVKARRDYQRAHQILGFVWESVASYYYYYLCFQTPIRQQTAPVIPQQTGDGKKLRPRKVCRLDTTNIICNISPLWALLSKKWKERQSTLFKGLWPGQKWVFSVWTEENNCLGSKNPCNIARNWQQFAVRLRISVQREYIDAIMVHRILWIINAVALKKKRIGKVSWFFFLERLNPHVYFWFTCAACKLKQA